MRIKSILEQINDSQLSRILLFIGALASITWSVYFAMVTIFIPYQIEFREGAAQVMTAIFLRGGNPFTFDNQPLAMNNYGVGYSLVVTPFAALFGNTLLVHRSVTFGFILLSAWLGFSVVRKKTQDYSLALTCAAFIMIGLIGRGGIGAFPSAMGTFLFLTATLIPFLRSFDRASLIISIMMALAAFYTKPYFILAFGIVFSYLFLFVSKKKGILYGMVFFVLLLVSLMVMGRIFPLYFINTIIGNVSNTHRDSAHLFDQLKDLLSSFYPILFLLFIFFVVEVSWKNIGWNGTGNFLNILQWNAPFVDHSFNYLFYSFVCSTIAFLFILGPHIGNYLNYAYQLMIPVFFCWLLQISIFNKKIKFVFILLVLFNLFIWSGKVLDPEMLKQKNSEEWAQVFEYVHSAKTTLNSPAITSEIIALGQAPIDSGQTSYFYGVDPFASNPFVGSSYEEFRKDGDKYIFRVDRMIEKQQFDLIITTGEKGSFYHNKFLAKYSTIDEIVVEMPQTDQLWTLVIWKPLLK